MSLSLIHEDFLDAWTESPTWESLKQRYIERHMPVLQVYHANFFTWQAQDPAAVLRDFQKRWGAEPEQTSQFIDKVRRANLPALMRTGYDAARAVLQPRQEPEAVCMVGLGTSNAFLMVVDGKPTIGLAAEVFGQEIMGIDMSFEDIPLWLAHEFSHAVRYAESDSLLARHSLDMAGMASGVPLLEILVDEGLAVHASAAVRPGAPASKVLAFPPGQLSWCEEHWDRLWAEISPRLHEPPGTDNYMRYFAFGAAKDIPPRAGYYAGWRLVGEHLKRTPGLTLAEAVRLPASHFAP